MATSESEAFVRSFARGLTVIEVLGQAPGRHSLADLADATKLPRTAVRRFILTLIDLEIVRTDGKLYWLTPRVLRLSLSYLSTLPYWREAQVALEELSSVSKQSCALSVLDGADIVYLQRQHAKRILPVSPSLGSLIPAYAVSMGRVLLSGLSDDEIDQFLRKIKIHRLTSVTITDPAKLKAEILKVRKQGYAWGEREFDDSICGLAVPVRDMSGGVIAAINVSLASGEFTHKTAVEQFLPKLWHTASRLRMSSPAQETKRTRAGKPLPHF